MLQTAAHKTSADIFKSERCAVKKLKCGNRFGYFDERKIKINGLIANPKKRFIGNCPADIRFNHGESGFGF